jgi:hypothetical protein
MIAVPTSAQVPIGRDAANPKPFLASYRALSVCTRELGRLTGMITADVTRLSSVLADEKPQVRQTPARCIIQLGPVALTLAWLRSTLDSAASGELLVIVWRGAVAPQQTHCPERTTADRSANAVTALWEEAFIAVATSEATWTWQRGTADAVRYSSQELAARCVERLRLAHAEA